jgi:hypothetical protein
LPLSAHIPTPVGTGLAPVRTCAYDQIKQIVARIYGVRYTEVEYIENKLPKI